MKEIKTIQGRSATAFCTYGLYAAFALRKAAYLLKKAGYNTGKGTSVKMPGTDALAFLKKSSHYVKKHW